MRVVIQRVLEASCIVDNKEVSSIKEGYLLYVGFTAGDNEQIVAAMAQKIINIRLFSDSLGKINLDIKSIKGEILSISQFTLYANCSNGNRPSFTEALEPAKASLLYDYFNTLLAKDIPTSEGIFGAEMQIKAINNGPVTIIIEK